MRNGSYYRTDNGRDLINAVRPVGHQISFVIVDPLLAVDDADPLKPHMHRVAIRARALQRQRPAGAADRAFQRLHRCFLYEDRAAAELEIVESLVDVRIVEKTAIGPASDKRVVAHLLLLASVLLPENFDESRRRFTAELQRCCGSTET